MIKWMLTLTAAAFLALMPPLAYAEVLDGTQWNLQEKGVRFWATDKLKFDDNQVYSDRLADEGFTPSAYTGQKSDDGVTWNAAQANNKGERVEWTGVSMGTLMNGTYVLTRSDGTSVTRQWSAEMVTP